MGISNEVILMVDDQWRDGKVTDEIAEGKIKRKIRKLRSDKTSGG